MCGHIIHEEESKLVRWGVTQPNAYSQNNKGRATQGFTQGFAQELKTSIYTRSYIIIFTNFEVLRIKISIEGTLMQMGVTKPSVTSTKDLHNHQRGSINKWHSPKHQGDPLNYELGSIIPT